MKARTSRRYLLILFTIMKKNKSSPKVKMKLISKAQVQELQLTTIFSRLTIISSLNPFHLPTNSIPLKMEVKVQPTNELRK